MTQIQRLTEHPRGSHETGLGCLSWIQRDYFITRCYFISIYILDTRIRHKLFLLLYPLKHCWPFGCCHMSPTKSELHHCIYVLLYFKRLPLAYLTPSWNSEQLQAARGNTSRLSLGSADYSTDTQPFQAALQQRLGHLGPEQPHLGPPRAQQTLQLLRAAARHYWFPDTQKDLAFLLKVKKKKTTPLINLI